MEDKILKESDIPMGYELCFNGGCADKDTCMHYQAMLLTSADRYKGNAVFPTAWQDGKCRCYHEKKLVKKAWGFTNLYNNVPHHGEILLSPKQQEEILQIVSQFGPLDGIKFDGYKTDWDFE